jgi:hypothetical protein
MTLDEFWSLIAKVNGVAGPSMDAKESALENEQLWYDECRIQLQIHERRMHE